MQPNASEQLHVAGATLTYTVQGSGPWLLLIPGGEGSRESYQDLSRALARRFTVVTYDRRGSPGSQLEDADQEVRLETHSEDAHQLLLALTDQPAYVFGSSGGALIGLDLAIRYPRQVRALVAHEPPVEGLLPEFDQYQAGVAGALAQAGVPAALAMFFAHSGLRYDDLEDGVVLPPRDPREAMTRGQSLMRYTFPAVHGYRLDVDALTRAPLPVTIAAGSSGQDTPVWRCTQALARRLGKALVLFPSHHAGYVSHPRAFAALLETVLQGES